MPYADRMRTALIGRAGDWLARRSWPQGTMLLSFAAAGLAGYAASLALDSLAAPGVALRIMLGSAAAYAGYGLFYTAWIRCQPTTPAMSLLEGAPADIETRSPWDDEDGVAERIERAFEQQVHQSNHNGDSGLGLLGFLLLVSLLGLVFVALHACWYARWNLGALLVDGGRIEHRALGPRDPWAWIAAPFRQSGVIALALAMNHATLAVIAQWQFPQANSLADVLRLMG